MQGRGLTPLTFFSTRLQVGVSVHGRNEMRESTIIHIMKTLGSQRTARPCCRLLAVAPCLLLALCGAGGGCRSSEVVRQDNLVTIKERLPLVPLKGASGDLFLEFRGKKYRHLYSYTYVLVPDLDAIIFATRREGRNIQLHYVPRQGNGEITVDEGDAYVFGGGLGRPKDDFQAEWVPSVADGKITFFSPLSPAEKHGGRTERHQYVLDLRARTFSEVTDGSASK